MWLPLFHDGLRLKGLEETTGNNATLLSLHLVVSSEQLPPMS